MKTNTAAVMSPGATNGNTIRMSADSDDQAVDDGVAEIAVGENVPIVGERRMRRKERSARPSGERCANSPVDGEQHAGNQYGHPGADNCPRWHGRTRAHDASIRRD